MPTDGEAAPDLVPEMPVTEMKKKFCTPKTISVIVLTVIIILGGIALALVLLIK